MTTSPNTRSEQSALLDFVSIAGPVDGTGVARAMRLPYGEAVTWLEEQAAAGYLHRDDATGRYATWCPFPRTR